MKIWLVLGAGFGLLGVAAGAFGAHALRTRLPEDLLAVFETAARYQMYHALALVLLGVLDLVRPHPLLAPAGVCFTLGIVLFSGSLFALALTGVRALGAVTPVGGLSLLAGWVLLGLASLRS